MQPWEGKRSIIVVSACMRSDGCPDFAFNEVEITFDEYENGLHYSLVGDCLGDAGYEDPCVHFDQFEAPAFLHAAVRQYLGVADKPVITEEKI